MSHNSFGHLFRFTTWGESHGPALGVVVDGCPPGLELSEGLIQPYLDKRRPGQSRFTTQRQEPDAVEILSGVYEGRTTGTPISLMIRNMDQRSKDYSEVAVKYRPGHADYAYDAKYGFRDPRGGGRSSARETAARVAAGAVARAVLGASVSINGYLVELGGDAIDRAAFDWAEIGNNPFFCPDAAAAGRWGDTRAATRARARRRPEAARRAPQESRTTSAGCSPRVDPGVICCPASGSSSARSARAPSSAMSTRIVVSAG